MASRYAWRTRSASAVGGTRRTVKGSALRSRSSSARSSLTPSVRFDLPPGPPCITRPSDDTAWAAELGHVFEALGTEVTIVNRGPRLLSDEDDDVSSRFTQAYARRFDLRLDAEVTAVSQRGSHVALRLERHGHAE